MIVEEPRNPVLIDHMDLVKAIAIASIAFYHYAEFVFNHNFALKTMGSAPAGWESPLLKPPLVFFSLGHHMWVLFIIVSGFGLSLSHLRSPVGWRVFFMKRFFRLLPLYWVAVTVGYFASTGVPFKALVAHFFLFQTYTEYRITFGALWFIGYIAHYYLLFPLLSIGLGTKRGIAVLFAAGLLLAFSGELLPAPGVAGKLLSHAEFLPVFIFGMALARWHHTKTRDRAYCKPETPGLAVVFASALATGLLIANRTALIDISKTLYMNVLCVNLFVSTCLLTLILRGYRQLYAFLAYAGYAVFLFHQVIFKKALQFLHHEGFVAVDFDKSGVYHFAKPWTVFAVCVFIFAATVAVSYGLQIGYDALLKKRGLPLRRT